jgi:hypothetical protein
MPQQFKSEAELRTAIKAQCGVIKSMKLQYYACPGRLGDNIY